MSQDIVEAHQQRQVQISLAGCPNHIRENDTWFLLAGIRLDDKLTVAADPKIAFAPMWHAVLLIGIHQWCVLLLAAVGRVDYSEGL